MVLDIAVLGKAVLLELTKGVEGLITGSTGELRRSCNGERGVRRDDLS